MPVISARPTSSVFSMSMGDTGAGGPARTLNRMSLSLRRPSWTDMQSLPSMPSGGGSRGAVVGALNEQILKSDAELLQALMSEAPAAVKREVSGKLAPLPAEGNNNNSGSSRQYDRATSDSGNRTSAPKTLLSQHLSSQLEDKLKLAPILARRLEGSSASGSFSSKVRTMAWGPLGGLACLLRHGCSACSITSSTTC